MQTYYIFVTGGVISGIGKGLFAASLGMLIKSYGYDVVMQKCDPYINVDPGLMSPYQHGEVFVTDDGAETDLDLGHYERFLDTNLTRLSSVTTGSIYSTVIQREREGGYNGMTVQVVPQIVDEIKARMRCFELISTVPGENSEPQRKHSAPLASTQKRFVIIEIGGTVGDMESTAFLEAMRQLIDDVGRCNACSFHVSYIPVLSNGKELKTKPTQHSVRTLLSVGIKPDFLVCRTDTHLPKETIAKLAHSCGLSKDHVIENFTVQSIYQLPLLIKHVPALVFNLFNVIPIRATAEKEAEASLDKWSEIVERFIHPATLSTGDALACKEYDKKSHIRIGLVGKYVELRDAYISVYEAIHHAAAHSNCYVDILSIVSDTCEGADRASSSTPAPKAQSAEPAKFEEKLHTETSNFVPATVTLENVDAIIIPGGFGSRGVSGKLEAIKYCRQNNKPILGICLGMQCMAIEFANNVLNLKDATSTEFDPETTNPVIATIISEDVKAANPLAATLIRGSGGSMRLGACNCTLLNGTLAQKCYQCKNIRERHRHRYEFNGRYKTLFEEAGVVFSGLSTESSLVEIMEIPSLDFFLGVQFHPELLSRPLKPHPLFVGLIGAALAKKRGM
ncbi:CTP synthase [Giardia duodenalis]|uniref:CTP synthase n=2 Tax=Giardia intestinalis TaxID=5741 RepID=E2RU94_GIAIC|nr:CTP synthase [Giardia intestinalis]AAB41453.1 cytidine triphosphate synthetase precursor [Giardia intestinalis]KAE8303741.1 CTP synthase [Giardia intestinalis]|eukprot:XP_001709668.1 CTP synthase [Giardia lamblia ATCC 50803]